MEAFDGISDEELVLRYRGGETGVLEYLVDKYKGLVRQKARAFFLVGGDTDDLIQEGMIGLFKAVQDYEEGHNASFLTFASLCIDRQLYRAIQNSNRQKNLPLNSYVSLYQDEELVHVPAFADESNPEFIVIDRENASALRDFLDRELSPLEGDVLSLYLQGENYFAIGKALDKTPKAIDNAIQRIRKKIGKHYGWRAKK